MRIVPSVGAGTLRPDASNVKQKTGKSFRASKQPAPALPPQPRRKHLAPVPPPPIPRPCRRASPLSPTETACLHILEAAQPYAVTARLVHESVPLWKLKDVVSALQLLAKRGRLLIHKAAADPADIKWRLLPARCPVIQLTPIPFDVSVPCTLELVRPPRHVGRVGVSRQVPVHGDEERGGRPCVIVHLEAGEPFEVLRNGGTVFCCEGKGWQGRPREVVSIRGTFTSGIFQGSPVPPCDLDGCLIVPTLAGRPLEVRFNDELRFAEPGE